MVRSGDMGYNCVTHVIGMSCHPSLRKGTSLCRVISGWEGTLDISASQVA